MPFSRAGQLARRVVTARASDPLALVAENLRDAPHGVLPVLDRITYGEGDPTEAEARVIGLIDANRLSLAPQVVAQAVATNDAVLFNTSGFTLTAPAIGNNGHSNGAAPEAESSPGPQALSEVTAGDIMSQEIAFIPSVFTLENALLTLERFGATALPVVDEAGYYRGVVSRADIMSAMARGVRPPMIGGVATPLGVYLTDGRLSGGASLLGLVLSGVFMGATLIISDALLQFLATLINRDWGMLWASGAAGMLQYQNEFGLFFLASTVLHGLVWLGLFRLTPMAGIHAAEHQTVWAMERGLPLEPEYVAEMPRNHPRCGTNLTVTAGFILLGWQHMPWRTPSALLFLLVFTFFFWRSVGTWVQLELTTRPASPKQLESGIKAAKELMAKYQDQPFATSALPLRLLNSGMIWVAGGFIGTTILLDLLRTYVAGLLAG